jgi:D-alanyl-D-alanine carboxypeptidase
LKLVDEGKLSLDDSVVSYAQHNHLLSKLDARITIMQLGNMTSGIPDYINQPSFLVDLDHNPYRQFTDDELLTYALKAKHLFIPGKGWYYSNSNYVILGIIAQAVSGETMVQLYQRIIFDPLSMNCTSVAQGLDIPTPFSKGYVFGYNSENYGPDNAIRDATNFNPSMSSYAGNVISTLEDLRVYAPAFVNGTLISPHAKSLRDKSFVSTPRVKYGFGIGEYKGWFGHNGSIPGYQTVMYYNPEHDMTLVILSNLQSELSSQGPANRAATIVIDRLEHLIMCAHTNGLFKL